MSSGGSIPRWTFMVWRYDRRFGSDLDEGAFAALWDHLEASAARIGLVRGGNSPVVSDDDVAELERRRPDAPVWVVDGAGHSIQGDRPLELAAVITRFVEGEGGA